MLHNFISTNRLEILARARAKVRTRAFPRPTEDELKNGVPLFLDQLVVALNLSHANTANTDAIGASATLHGGDLLRMGFTIAQVVHDYGDICQAVTELAVETDAPITVDEFRMLNKSLDDAIAQAVTEYARLRERSRKDQATERSGALAHELRNRLNAAMLAFAALKTGQVGIDGSTGRVLDRTCAACAT